MRVLSVSTPTHGRVLIEDAADSFSGRLLVGCHGYGQAADTMLEEMQRIPGSEAWRLVSVQALHRFYKRGDDSVIASWMTRQDRESAIADNIQYVNRAVTVAGAGDARTILFIGFSQGASMAARAAVRGNTRAAGLIMLGGDIPLDVRDDAAGRWPPVLIGCGDRDTWYGERVESDAAFLRARGVPHEIVRFNGGHEFTDEFRQAAAVFIRDRG